MGLVVVEQNPKQWLKMPEHEMEQILSNIRDENLRLCLSFGIGLHHAGLVEKDRRVVEELFTNQKIQILITTATLAWGVNFPAHLVVVKGTEYFDGKTKRYVDFPITDHINAEIVAGTINSKQEALDYLTWTYFFRRLVQNPSYYGLELDNEAKPEGAINAFLSSTIDRALNCLESAYCIEIGADNRTVQTTPLGRIASFYYLSHQTIQLFQNKLSPTVNMEDLLDLLTQAHEYDELPVRHNEDNLNGDLAKCCPIEVNAYTYDSSHTKAHLLLQAHMSRLQLPCVDYLTDTKSAMLDICGCAGWLAAALQVQVLMQMVTQARWHTDNSLLTLPHVNSDSLYCFKNVGNNIQCLPELVQIIGGKYEKLAKMLRQELDEGQIENVFKTLQQLPVLNVITAVRGWWANTNNHKEVRVNRRTTEENRKASDWIQVHADQDYSLASRDLRVHAPKFPKVKDEGWFLVLGEATSGELLALKRVPPVRDRATHVLSFRTPDTLGISPAMKVTQEDSEAPAAEMKASPPQNDVCNSWPSESKAEDGKKQRMRNRKEGPLKSQTWCSNEEAQDSL
ncbi:Activating signal cointegrator 1 complex subunit 3-like 2 [Homarus americanus]|uniref:Activating signal cointegrator 1 complex subunit 3-like 2 n=1 Tax=Homarus americanus TaxID=6706 RepID=A0A8J5K3R4_HOMAM|nr:Activating signal cointegrator 1 complex subunit 3-like 2 [Homarus americanus]